MTAPSISDTAATDRQDIARVLAGDREAYADLVDRHQGRIIAHLTRLVGRDAADDLAQESFVRAYQALGRYDPTYPFRGWLLVIASRLAANPEFTDATVEAALRALAAELGLKPGVLINAARAALTGQAAGPSAFHLFTIIGRDRAISRLRAVAE